jgi:hypothetical protein
MHCEICCWNDAYELFDDTNYENSKNTLYNGYNISINQNCYNYIYVCYFCLIEKVYCCDLEKYDATVLEIKKYMASKLIGKWWFNKLYDIDDKIGKKFITNKVKSWNF